jgi:hypothetical protein
MSACRVQEVIFRKGDEEFTSYWRFVLRERREDGF